MEQITLDKISNDYFNIYADTILGKNLHVNLIEIIMILENLNFVIDEAESKHHDVKSVYILAYKFYRLQKDIAGQMV